MSYEQILSKLGIDLYGETFFETGSAAYELEGHEAGDLDFCILCEEGGEDRIRAKLAYACMELELELKVQPIHCITDGWGGTTILRLQAGPLDFFLVDRPTFHAVRRTTNALRNQPPVVKQRLLNKPFRVKLFHMLVEEFYVD